MIHEKCACSLVLANGRLAIGLSGILREAIAWFIAIAFCANVGKLEAQTTVVASDNFNRANGPIGTNWTDTLSAGGNFVVTNDLCGVDTENVHVEAFWSANSFSNNQFSQITLSSTGPWTGVILRADGGLDPIYTNSGSQFYLGFVFGPNDYRIENWLDNAYYQESVGSTETWQTNDVLRLEISGSTNSLITMYRNGNPVLLWLITNPAYERTGGSPGIGIYSRTGAGLTLSDWEGGNLNPDTNAPTVPANLAASALGPQQINLNWTASTDNVGVVGYLVERSQGAGSTNFILLDTPTGTNYNDTNSTTPYTENTTNSASLQPGTTYNYRLQVADAAGNLSGYSSVASATTPPGGLVAAYGFNEGTGTTVTDASGNGNNGTISGATWTTAGKYGDALVFNGTSAMVTVSNSATLQLSAAMTLEAWVNPVTVSSAWRDVIYKANDNYYLEGTTMPNGWPGIGETIGTSDVVLYGTGTLPVNTWTHLAATYDGTTTRLYVNGTQVSSQAQTGAFVTSTNPLQIGGDSLYGQFFHGTIDEVRIYNMALTAAQIQTDMNTPIVPAASANITGISLSGSNLVINGTNGIFGLTYYVLMTTNLALPGSQWTPVATNVWSANGNFSLTVTNAVSPSVPKQFYLLQVP
jgi:hypothetical protein